jgi:ketosteroid isomerase-like protein
MRSRNCCIALAVLLACFTGCLTLNASSPQKAQPLTAQSLNAILARQMQAWQTQDFSIAAGDWLRDGKLISPGGEVKVNEMQPVIVDYAKHFRDLRVTIQRAILSQDGKTATIVWDWDVTRIRDGKRGVTHDAIIVDFEGAKIKTWHEYFDLGNSVDANP